MSSPPPRSTPITSAFNDGYIAEVYESFLRDAASVDESWRQFFRFAASLSGSAIPSHAEPQPELLRKVAGAASLVDAIRAYGHLDASIDPLGTRPPSAPELLSEFHGVADSDLARIPGAALGFDDATAADVVARLRRCYSSSIGFEFEHVGSAIERAWLRSAIESGEYHAPLSAEEKRAALRRLTQVDGLERFLGRAYQGYKRFSIEGNDALLVILDEIIALAAAAGARQVAVAMAHRGRINVLAHTMGKPYARIFDEFEGRHASSSADGETRDVKYHLGYHGSREVAGRAIALTLVPNPSHLEFVNPVLAGVARAGQRLSGGGSDESATVPVAIHGDAAFPGEGVVAETFNMSLLRGYRVGGTLHVIVNNQIGFTTDPTDARSTRYASDLAKGFDVPIVHVNGDEIGPCVQAARLAVAYRVRFGKDFLIDLVGYRRHGHNETDEPAFTQPTLYARVRAHPAPRELWGARLAADGVMTESEVQAVEREVVGEMERIQASARPDSSAEPAAAPATARAITATAVPAERLIALNAQLLAWPEGFRANPRVARNLARRADAMGESGGIDWGHAEVLAFASLLQDGTSVRMSGQDVERGTFSHRQDVLHHSETGDVLTPLQHIPGAAGTFEIYNSPLSETAVLGFEYGYSTAAPGTLVLWEAQYGDFVNVAQPVIDQFIASDRAKWGQDSALVLLLPHGYEGGGPEHSSARLERFLQLAAESNMRVAYPSTPAQYFHILRRQAHLTERRPLILMQPKSLLRSAEAASTLTDLSAGAFRAVIDDPAASEQRERVRRVVFCTGKLYYNLAESRTDEVALVRVEELYPWPHDQIAQVVDAYPAIDDVVWAQEEPKNMGAWSYVAPRLRVSTGNAIVLRYVGRPERASPAEGYEAEHKAAQARIIGEVFALPQLPRSGRQKAGVRN